MSMFPMLEKAAIEAKAEPKPPVVEKPKEVATEKTASAGKKDLASILGW